MPKWLCSEWFKQSFKGIHLLYFLLTYRLKDLEPEEELGPTEFTETHDFESTVKETVITGAPAQFVSDRNRDRPQTPTLPPPSSPREKPSLPSDTTYDSVASQSSTTCTY